MRQAEVPTLLLRLLLLWTALFPGLPCRKYRGKVHTNMHNWKHLCCHPAAFLPPSASVLESLSLNSNAQGLPPQHKDRTRGEVHPLAPRSARPDQDKMPSPLSPAPMHACKDGQGERERGRQACIPTCTHSECAHPGWKEDGKQISLGLPRRNQNR